jgi:hypothetical protein
VSTSLTGALWAAIDDITKATGRETSRLRRRLNDDGSALVDAQGQAQPLRVLNAAAREVTAPSVSSLYPVPPVAFNDEGGNGDRTAGDGELSTLLQRAAQGFAGLAGQIRLESSWSTAASAASPTSTSTSRRTRLRRGAVMCVRRWGVR